MLRDAPIVLLDEPTEHLDPENERIVTAALSRWLPGRTTVLITHRPTLLELCDTVVRLERDSTAAEAKTGGEPVLDAKQNVGLAADSIPDDVKASPAGHVPLHLRRRIILAVVLGCAAALSSVGLAASSAWLISEAALRPPLLTLQVGIAAVQAFGFGRATLRYAERLAGHDATLRLLAELRVRVFQGLLRRAPAGMSGVRGGDLLATLTADVDAVQDLFLKVLLPAAAAGLTVSGLVLFDALTIPAAALILALGAAVAGIVAPLLTRAAARQAEARTQSARAQLSDDVVDTLAALPDVIAYGAAPQRLADIAGDDTRLAALERRGALAGGLGAALGTLASGVTTALLAAVALGAVDAGQVSGPLAAAVVLAALAMFETLAVLPDAARAADRGRAAWARLQGIADAPPLVPVPDAPVPVRWGPDSVLAFDHVDGRWPGADRLAVRDVSFRLRAGEHLLLTGPSGAGKSTIAALAARGLDPVAGTVRVDGVDLRAADPDRVRDVVVVCDQDAHLFDTTVAENLRVGLPDASEAELWRVLTLVGLDRWAAALPAGLATPVGQLGDAVSGGERRRLALARTLLSPAPVVVLDEPTAHLDADTARLVEANLARELRHRTVLRIGHDGVRHDAVTRFVPILRASTPDATSLRGAS
ncbi:thiol reductant ABC exporter subunit CydC [Catenulispora yoronensis]